MIKKNNKKIVNKKKKNYKKNKVVKKNYKKNIIQYSKSKIEPKIEPKIEINIEPKETEYTIKLKEIHTKLKIDYGTFNEEVPEQLMVIKYITGNEKILELGGNIGRNTLVISYILNNNNNNNLVTFESDPNIAQQLIHNREQNNLDFKIESSALSNRKLLQKGWDTIVLPEMNEDNSNLINDLLLEYKPVNTINYNEFKEKYNIDFDTLIVDCEGALYYILMDMPQILDSIKLIIMENDYHDINYKIFIDKILKEKEFKLDYVESGGWGPCYENFFEVWKK